MAITTATVRALIPLTTGQLPDALLQKYIDIVTSEADLAFENIFANPLSTVTEADCINFTTNNTWGSSYVAIRAWQETVLTIKRIRIDDQHKTSLAEVPLVLGDDYALYYGWKGNKIPGKPLPVTNIILFCRLHPSEVLRVYGTYGWQAGYPKDVEAIITQIIADMAMYAQQYVSTGGVTALTRIKSMTTELEQGSQLAEKLRNYARNFMDDPAYQAILNKYRNVTENQLTVI